MCVEKTDWEKAVEFHGHSCPGLAIGFRVARIALQELAGARAADEELVAIVENDACGVDAIQFLTGCTLGKGNLIFRDFGKHVYTFVCRNSGKALRIAVRERAWKREEEGDSRRLRERVMSGEASEEEEKLFALRKEERTRAILEALEEDLCSKQLTTVQVPVHARIFNSVMCAYCGEPVSESRARIREGKIACIPCAGEYTRGW